MIIPVNPCLTGKFALLLIQGMLWEKVYQTLKKLLDSNIKQFINKKGRKTNAEKWGGDLTLPLFRVYLI
jgi:hypothetical protein